jgi:hypothetical protein
MIVAAAAMPVEATKKIAAAVKRAEKEIRKRTPIEMV